MSVGSNLQEMENVVTKNAAPGDPMPKLTTGVSHQLITRISAPQPQKTTKQMTILPKLKNLKSQLSKTLLTEVQNLQNQCLRV